MKVWIAMDKDENELLGIFDSKKKAQDAIEKRARWQWDEMEEEDEPFGTLEDWLQDARENDMPGLEYWEETVQ